VTLSAPVIGFAHRGARSECRENTLAAFQRALEIGAAGLESDAWLTADGEVVLDHDGVIGPPWRRRAIGACRRAELPVHIPTLEELYRECGADFELSLDLKDTAALEGVVGVARSAGASERLWICHHDWRVMAAWRRAAPEVRLVESSNLAWMREGLGARVSALAATGIAAINLHRSQWSSEVRDETRSVGLAGFAWDAQTEADLTALVELGVDAVYSDHVDRMVAVLRRAGGEEP
jgi:glycerophosphoryl diester phosphodiesterase